MAVTINIAQAPLMRLTPVTLKSSLSRHNGVRTADEQQFLCQGLLNLKMSVEVIVIQQLLYVLNRPRPALLW